MDNILLKITTFLTEIGLEVQMEEITGETFLPGMKIRNGSLIIDAAKLKYPGDILHEAGHLACMPPQIRINMSDELENNDLHKGGEMMAIAWSYAACLHLNIDPAIVFHEAGYKGGSQNLIKNFSEGHFIGVPLMEWQGMTYMPQTAQKLNQQAFPVMQQWICHSRPL